MRFSVSVSSLDLVVTDVPAAWSMFLGASQLHSASVMSAPGCYISFNLFFSCHHVFTFSSVSEISKCIFLLG